MFNGEIVSHKQLEKKYPDIAVNCILIDLLKIGHITMVSLDEIHYEFMMTQKGGLWYMNR